jgi:flagellar biosynthesis protein FliR
MTLHLRWPRRLSAAGVQAFLSGLAWAALAGLILGLGMGLVLRLFMETFSGHGVLITVA